MTTPGTPATARFVLLTALAAGALSPSPAEAAPQLGAGAGVTAVVYDLDDPAAVGLDEAFLIHAPFATEIPIGSALALQLEGGWASATVTGPGGGEATLSGLTDTRVGISSVIGGHLAMGVSALLPTGSATRSRTEAAVEGVVASELLAFPLASWGAGGGFGGEAGASLPLGGTEVGLVAGYRVAREYEPLGEDEFAYRPGDELSVRVSLDAPVGAGGYLTVSVAGRRYGDDLIEDRNLFQSGDRVEGLASLTLPAGLRGAIQIWAGVQHRSEGTLLFDTEMLDGAGNQPSRQLLMGGIGLRAPLAGAVVVPSLDGRWLRASDDLGEGWLGTAGVDLEVPLGRTLQGARLVLVPGGRVRLGELRAGAAGESSVLGWEAGLVLRWEPPVR